jgi:ring-1,2-phenylacetyl-CoA epoxidase subunit PaaC
MPELALSEYAMRLGDDALVLGQRLSEWCGRAPALEIDLSLANLGLDLLGQAQHFLGRAAELRGRGEDADTLAFRRDVLDYRNCLLVEQPNGDFAQTMARQFIFSVWQELFLTELQRLSDPVLAAVAAKAVKETAYHARLAGDWVVRLGDGTDESRERMIRGLGWMWRFTDELFEVDELEADLATRGYAVDRAALRETWAQRIAAILSEAGLSQPPAHRAVTGGRRGRHSEHLGHMLAEMQFLQRAYPDSRW